MQILIVTPDKDAMKDFAEGLAKGTDGDILFAATAAEGLDLAKSEQPAFAVLDEGLDMATLKLAFELLKVNAMVNTAVVSSMDPEEFHEESEGLGILAPVSPSPTAADGAALAEVFRRFM